VVVLGIDDGDPLAVDHQCLSRQVVV
jgi:hypothetical protein